MILTLTADCPNAGDLSYLLAKSPSIVHERELAFGKSVVFYPEYSANRVSAALAVEVDTVGLARGSTSLASEGYVSDRPYAIGSLFSVALARTFAAALAGRSRERPDGVSLPMPLTARLAAVRAPGGEATARKAFEPLGYTVSWLPAAPRPLESIAGSADVATLEVAAVKPVRDVLRHLYILAPVIDNSKHYFVGRDEADKLLRHGEGWLAEHPGRDWIVARYLRYKKELTRRALASLTAESAGDDEVGTKEEEELEAPVRLHDLRIEAVLGVLRDPDRVVRSVLDLGCGEGRLCAELVKDARFERILGVDVSSAALDRACKRISGLRAPAHRKRAFTAAQGSLVYRDDRFEGFDAAVLLEVIEHVDPFRLDALERVMFGSAVPDRVIVTTPNREYNRTWPALAAGGKRHRDHRFEWTRDEFRAWCERVCRRFRYAHRMHPIGPEDAELGPPTQMAVFDRLSLGGKPT